MTGRNEETVITSDITGLQISNYFFVMHIYTTYIWPAVSCQTQAMLLKLVDHHYQLENYIIYIIIIYYILNWWINIL